MDKKKFIGIIIALIIIGLCSYFFYYTKTPTYSLNLIKDSIQKHDVATFKKHVDLDSLISRGYDDLMAVSMNDLKDNSLGAGFAKGLIEMMKPTITNALKDGALRAVENGKWEDVPSNGQTDTSSVKSEEIADRAGIKSASFKGIEYTKKDGKTAIVGDGQVTLGHTVFKSGAKKIRKIEDKGILAGFAGTAADAFTLFDKFEKKLDEHGGNLRKACVELAKDWRSDKVLRTLDAMLIVADKNDLLILSGTGDVLEPDDNIAAIGSGGTYALSAAKALYRHTELSASEIVREAMQIAGEICIYTNTNISVEEL